MQQRYFNPKTGMEYTPSFDGKTPGGSTKKEGITKGESKAKQLKPGKSKKETPQKPHNAPAAEGQMGPGASAQENTQPAPPAMGQLSPVMNAQQPASMDGQDVAAKSAAAAKGKLKAEPVIFALPKGPAPTPTPAAGASGLSMDSLLQALKQLLTSPSGQSPQEMQAQDAEKAKIKAAGQGLSQGGGAGIADAASHDGPTSSSAPGPSTMAPALQAPSVGNQAPQNSLVNSLKMPPWMNKGGANVGSGQPPAAPPQPIATSKPPQPMGGRVAPPSLQGGPVPGGNMAHPLPPTAAPPRTQPPAAQPPQPSDGSWVDAGFGQGPLNSQGEQWQQSFTPSGPPMMDGVRPSSVTIKYDGTRIYRYGKKPASYGGERPMANGQPTYPEGMPPIAGGGPTRPSDQEIEGPLAPGSGPSNSGENPGSVGGGLSSRTPSVLDQADQIENDTYGRKHEKASGGGRHDGLQPPTGGGHPGFGAVQNSIARREGVPKEEAGAILASATRKASPSAKKANPHLKKVKGPAI